MCHILNDMTFGKMTHIDLKIIYILNNLSTILFEPIINGIR